MGAVIFESSYFSVIYNSILFDSSYIENATLNVALVSHPTFQLLSELIPQKQLVQKNGLFENHFYVLLPKVPLH